MGHEELDEKVLRALAAGRAPAPSPVATEAFVARVMSRLPEAPGAAWERWLAARWLVPAFGLGLAALVFSFRLQTATALSPDAAALLAGTDRGPLSGWVSGRDDSTADLLAYNGDAR
jgi:hypothetical protein